MIAGPCSVESREQAFAIAEKVSGSRRSVLPRRPPTSRGPRRTRSRGWAKKALKIMAEIRDRFGLRHRDGGDSTTTLWSWWPNTPT